MENRSRNVMTAFRINLLELLLFLCGSLKVTPKPRENEKNRITNAMTAFGINLLNDFFLFVVR